MKTLDIFYIVDDKKVNFFEAQFIFKVTGKDKHLYNESTLFEDVIISLVRLYRNGYSYSDIAFDGSSYICKQ